MMIGKKEMRKYFLVYEEFVDNRPRITIQLDGDKFSLEDAFELYKRLLKVLSDCLYEADIIRLDHIGGYYCVIVDVMPFTSKKETCEHFEEIKRAVYEMLETYYKDRYEIVTWLDYELRQHVTGFETFR